MFSLLTASKKDKPQQQRKQTPQSDDKRGKRKKDETTVEKIETPDFILEVGDKLKVYYHEKKVTYEAKVIEIAVQRGTPMYLVHYTGWNNRYDEWVPRERIAENLTKGSKQKGGRPEGKSKENPPKPPTAASLASSSSNSSSSHSNASISTLASVSKTPTSSAKRGRGRSDSLPPRSTTPSSVASNSSRTKSPATSSIKRRPTRTIPTTSSRRTSANVSDVSMATESDDSDSDEPVRRPTRGGKEIPYKSRKKSGKALKTSVSAGNSQTESDDDEEEDDEEDTPVGGRSTRVRSMSGSLGNSKGRDYDLNQIRSELKGFQGLKSPSPEPAGDESKESIIVKKEVDSSAMSVKTESKEANKTSSTEVSSETDSFVDDDSQSSDKTTTLENMTKKFQQKINADKQRAAMEKTPKSSNAAAAERAPLARTRIVEKILNSSLAEKRQESLKAKPLIKEEIKIKQEFDVSLSTSKLSNEIQMEDKKSLLSSTAACSSETKPSIIAPARISGGNSSTSSLTGVSKYTSVIVEKPLGIKKSEIASVKKEFTPKKTELSLGQAKKFIELKDIVKNEGTLVGSPASSTSSCSSASSSSTTATNSSRSLPDMSKLDISGQATKDAKTKTSSLALDIYEFKDTEPFEFEVRKSPMAASSSAAASVVPASAAVALTPRKPLGKTETSPNAVSALINRKKRGSPLKESIIEKSNKQSKMEEKSIANTSSSSSVLADAKLSVITNTSAAAAAAQASISPPIIKPTAATASKPLISGSSLAPPLSVHITPQKPLDHAQATFDVIRKSPSFNMNINLNALNEELAQTVQETTRALTDALQTTPNAPKSPCLQTNPSNLTPTALAADNIAFSVAVSQPAATSTIVASSINTTPLKPLTTINTNAENSPKMVTPPKPSSSAAVPNKNVVGSPFVETRKDLSNVFELSTGEGSGSSCESKDNKFELLLSASVGAFDLVEPKYENKPTSIADKVLKAISQKKEETENKTKFQQDAEKQQAEELSREKLGVDCKTLPTTTTLKLLTLPDMPSGSAGVLASSGLIEPLKINTDLPSISGLKKEALSSSSLDVILGSRRTPLASPDTKVGILESITVKNNDLSETIQKLECAIQRKTPVGGIGGSGNTPTITPAVTPVPTTAASSSAAMDHFSDNSNDSTDSERRLVIEDSIEEPSTSEKSPSTMPIINPTPIKMDAAAKISGVAPIALKAAALGAGTVLMPAHQMMTTGLVTTVQQNPAGNVVPIDLPDIPVSVVVASSAVPSVMAAAQAAAAGVPARNSNAVNVPAQIAANSPAAALSPHGISVASSNSSFTTNAPLKSFETGVQTIVGNFVAQNVIANTAGNTLYLENKLTSGMSAALKHATPTDDALSLLCEETIPGSPAPAFGGKDETPLQRSMRGDSQDSNATNKDIPSSSSGTSIGPMSNIASSVAMLQPGLHHTNNSSPNDSASQDESCEDLKKSIADADNEASPRKRRRTRKQSEIVSMGSDLQSKRRRAQATSRKNTGIFFFL